MATNSVPQVRSVLVATLVVVSFAAVATPAAAGIDSASRSAPSSVATGGTATVTVTATMNDSGGDVTVSESFNGPVRDASIERVAVDGAQATPTLSSADDSGVIIVLENVPARAQIEVTYDIEANSSTGQIYVGGDVSDGDTRVSLGTDSISVKSSNSQPNADAGPDRTVTGGSTITLDGTGSSDPDGDSLAYYWNGSQYLDDRNSATPTFDAPSVSSRQTFRLNLLVTDPSGASDGDSVTVTVDPSNSLSSTDVDGDGLYEDVNGDGTVDVLDPRKLENDINDAYVQNNAAKFDFDGDGDADADDVCALYAEVGTQPSSCQQSTTASASFALPSLSAPASVTQGETLVVDATVENTGTASDTKTVEFVFDGSVAESVSVSLDAGQSTTLRFEYDTGGLAAGSYGYGVTTPDDSVTGTVDVTASNSAPTADAGPDRTVDSGSTITLDGTGSTDPDGDDLSYSWSRSDTTDTYAGATPTLTVPGVDTETTLTVDLRVTDGDGASDTDSVTLTVVPVNGAPTADAGPDRAVRADSTITLDGTGSTDPDGDDLRYTWRQLEGPAVDIDADGATATVDPSAAGTAVIELRVSDGLAADTDTVAVDVVPPTTTEPSGKGPETTTRTTTVRTTTTPTTTSTTATTTRTPVPEPRTTTTRTPVPPPDGDGGGGGPLADVDLPLVPAAGGGAALLTLLLVGALWRRRGRDGGASATTLDDGPGGAATTTDDRGDDDEPDTDEPDTDEPDTDEPDTDEPDTDEPGWSEDGLAGVGPDESDWSEDGLAGVGPDGSDSAGTATNVDGSAAGTDATPSTGGDATGAAPAGFGYDDLRKGERLGGGGNADVYLAGVAGPHGDVDVALKEPRLQGTISTADVEQVLAEAETWHKLDDHEGVVDVLGWGSEPLPWIAMEYMDGGNLADALPLGFERARQVLVSVASAVEYAHRAGVAHGDLKPANVLFAGDPARGGTAKVGDWGLAKVLLEGSRSTDGLSPAYAAPEQFEGGTSDIVGPQLTDVYQLGAVAYEVFTGRPPFEGTPFEVMEGVKSADPRPPTEVDPTLPSGVDEVVLTAMAKDPDERYETMTDLRRALERL